MPGARKLRRSVETAVLENMPLTLVGPEQGLATSVEAQMPLALEIVPPGTLSEVFFFSNCGGGEDKAAALAGCCSAEGYVAAVVGG